MLAPHQPEKWVRNLCYFALFPEDEARVESARLATNRNRIPLLLVPRGALGVVSAFNDRRLKLAAPAPACSVWIHSRGCAPVIAAGLR